VSLFGADRTEKQFETLLDDCGLELVKSWRPGVLKPESRYMFEAALKK